MSENYGKFSGNPKTEWLSHPTNPDRDMKLLEDFWYIDPEGNKWLAPAGSIVNGASIPRPLWTTVGSPYTDDYRNASVVHDIACANIDWNNNDADKKRRLADKMFYYACLAGGCSKDQAEIFYIGVRIGAWSSKTGNSLPFNWRDTLYRISGEKTVKETKLLSKFNEIISKKAKDKGALAFEALERLVDKAIK